MLLKILMSFRFIVNPILSLKLFRRKSILKFSKKIYSNIFNKHGIDMSQRYIVEIDIKIQDILKKYNGYLGCGNCLFIAREQPNFNNQDIDYCIQDKSRLDEFINDCAAIGMRLKSRLFFNDILIELKFFYKDTYVDFFLLDKNEDNSKFTNSYAILINDHFPKINKIDGLLTLTNCDVIFQKWPYVSNTIGKKMFGHSFLIPSNYKEYLYWQYGEDWEIPRSDFDFFVEPKNNPPIIYKNQGRIIYYS